MKIKHFLQNIPTWETDLVMVRVTGLFPLAEGSTDLHKVKVRGLAPVVGVAELLASEACCGSVTVCLCTMSVLIACTTLLPTHIEKKQKDYYDMNDK